MNRRSFLWTLSSLSVASMLSSCENQYDLQVALLQGSLPIQLIASLQKQGLGKINFKPQSSIEDIYKLLIKEEEEKDKKNTPSDLMTLGHYWLKDAISKNSIEPLELDKFSNWQNIPPRFQQLVNRDNQGKLTENGQLWGAPYRWGYTMIAYRQDKFEELGWQPQDWQDLWRSQLQGRISLLNQPREIIGLILKKLGHSYNTQDINSMPEVAKELKSLHQQVKFYDSTNYLQPLIMGDTWLAVGWSADILPVLATRSNIKGIIARSGTALWADVWVKPKQDKNEEDKLKRISELINFCWDTASGKQINLFTNGISPLKLSGKTNPKIPRMSEEIFAKSDFIEPLSPQDLEQYHELLLKL
ncbi:extracellular solute-binding protein [Geminocystis herdmanii]|uniref:extracellular solute-binding protein n=1 Tax=Geminocystis herdmanii TaxID=669359 RepID=UPI00034BB9D3|nr:extracellular solute-binding protein [Geminocystis herdmanii]